MMTKWYTYDYLYKTIADFFKKDDLPFYPQSPFNLCKDLGIGLIPYTWKTKDLINISEDGFSVRKGEKYYIFYNEDIYSRRVTFTIAHEIGHIVLKHHDLIGSDVLMSGGFGIAEDQANIFARNILMPPKLTKAMPPYNLYGDQYKYYNLSKQMYDIRIRHLDHDLIWVGKFF